MGLISNAINTIISREAEKTKKAEEAKRTDSLNTILAAGDISAYNSFLSANREVPETMPDETSIRLAKRREGYKTMRERNTLSKRMSAFLPDRYTQPVHVPRPGDPGYVAPPPRPETVYTTDSSGNIVDYQGNYPGDADYIDPTKDSIIEPYKPSTKKKSTERPSELFLRPSNPFLGKVMF